MTNYQTIETPQDYVNYTFNISARGVAEVTGEMAGLSNTITTMLGQLAFKTSEYLTHTETLVIGLGATAVASFASATQEAIKFEQAIANVQAIGGESINAHEIGAAAMQYSSKFAMDVNGMTEGLEALSRAGLTATNVMSGVLEEGVKLSKLEGIDLEESINDLIATTNLLAEKQYDVNSPEYANAVKEMNQHIVSTSESAPINAQNIIQSLQHVGGYASANKIDQDDLFAVIAQLGAKGTKGEMAGTALRAFIAAGQKDQAQRALARIGLNVSDLWDESGEAMLPVSEMKQVLDEALESRGYSKQEKLEFYSDFAGYKQANQIMKIDTTEVQEYKKTISEAWDLGKKLDTILGTTHNNIQTLFQTVKNFMTRVGETTLPIINAIVIPLKWGVKLLEAMPFSENIVGMLMVFTGLKATLLLINRVVPSLASMYTSFDKGEQKAKGISGHFHNLLKDLKQSKDIIDHITDTKYLSNLNFKNGVMGQQSYKQHQNIVETIYRGYYEDNDNVLAWDELKPVQKEMYYAKAEAYKDTELYQKILKQFNESNSKHMEKFGEFLLQNEEEKPTNNININYNKSKTERRQDQDSGLVNKSTEISSNDIDKSTKEITNATKESIGAIKSLGEKLNQQALYSSKGKTQHNITNAILNSKEALAEAIGRAIYQKFNTETKTVSKDLGDVQVDRTKSDATVKQLQEIEASVSTDLGDIGYFLDYDKTQIDSLLATVKNDLQQKITAYSNNTLDGMNDTQRHRMEKIISRAAKTELGAYYSAEQNNINVREFLVSETLNKSRGAKIRDSQIDAIENVLNIRGNSGYDRETRLNKIHKHIRTELTDKAKKDNKIAEILKATENVWIEEEKAKDLPSLEASKFLTNGRAIHIGRAVGIDSINWDSIQNPAQALLEYFKDADTSKKKRDQLKQADKLMFTFLEKDNNAVFNEAEAQEIGYLIKRYKQLLLARNKAIEKEGLATHYNNKSIDYINDFAFYENPFTGTIINELDEIFVVNPFFESINDSLNDIKAHITTNIQEQPSLPTLPNYDAHFLLEKSNIQEALDMFVASTVVWMDTELDSIGRATPNGRITFNPKNVLRSASNGDLTEAMLETYAHEAGHIMLNHRFREYNTNDFKDIEYGQYEGKEIINELESELLGQRVLSLLGMTNTTLTQNNIQEYTKILSNNGLLDNVRYDLINQLGEEIVNQKDIFFDNLIKELQYTTYNSNISSALMQIMAEGVMKISKTTMDRYLNDISYGTNSYYNNDNGEGFDENEAYQEMLEREKRIDDYEARQHSEPMASKTSSTSCCSEIKKFLQTITGHLTDYTKFFAKTDNKLTEIIDILNDILGKEEEPPVINNIYNTLNIFQQNMDNNIKALPQNIGKEISQNFLLPAKTIPEEDFIEVKALVVEDIEKAVLMIDTAYIAPNNVTEDYKESNLSLRELYEEVYGPKQPEYNTPPLLTSLMALPEKIQEVTTDFVLLGEAIDLSKQALEEYLRKNTILLALPEGSSKGYHNAYPENAGIFPPLPTDTLTPTRNTYTRRVINAPYKVTEQQLRSVGLHGLIPMWQQNLKRFTPYNTPIGPNPDNTDLGKYQQSLAIEEEKKEIKRRQEAQAEADLQAREKEKLIGITERYNKKMAEQKIRLDAVAQAQNQRYQNFKQEKKDLLQLAFTYDIIKRAEEKRETFKNIDYRTHKANYSFNQGRIGYYNYLNDIGLRQIEEDKRNQKLIDGHNQIPKKPTTKEEIENILINNRADKESAAILEHLDNTIEQLYKAIADRNVEKHILQVVGAYIRSDYDEAIGPLTYEEYVKQSLQAIKDYFADDRQRQRDIRYDKQIADIVDKNFITQDSGYIPKGMPTGLEQAAIVKEQQEEKYAALSPEKKGELEIIQFYENEKKLREEEHNRILENENKRTKTIEERIIEEKNIRQGLLNLNKIEEKIQAEKRKNIIKERLLIDELNRKFNTGLYELTDEELELIGKGEYSKKGNSRVRADAMAEKRKIEQQKRLEEEARRIGNIYSSGYRAEEIPDIDEYQNKVKKEAQKRKQIEENKHIAQQQISQYSAGYDVENIPDEDEDKYKELREKSPEKVLEGDDFWREIERQEQEAVLSKVEQANAAVEAYKRHQEALQKQIKHQLKKEIEAIDGLLVGFNDLADEAETISQQASNPMREQEEQRRKKIERENFWAEQERLEQEVIIAEELGPQMLETMKHQLGATTTKAEDLEKEAEEIASQVSAGKFQHISGNFVGYDNETFATQKQKEAMFAKYGHFMAGVGVNANYEGLSATEKATMKADHKYGKVSPDRKQSWGERAERFGIKLGTAKEQFFNVASNIADKYPEEQANEYAESIDKVKNTVKNSLQPVRELSNGLQRASEVFPPFAIAASGLNTIISIGEGVVWALNLAETVLNAEKTFDTLVTWGLITAEQAETLSKGLATVATWGLTTAISILETVMLPLVAVVLAVVAAIEILKFTEKQHAKALKESQEELQKATSKNNIALSQYKDLKKARENETDAIKKQQAARKEAIALYKLEAARVERRNAVHKEAKLRNDAIWGEYGFRASLQKMGLGFIAGGDFESQAENYDGTTKNIREIKEATLGNLFATSAQREAAGFYDRNQMFFAEVEAYKEPLQELYDKESKLIEQYGDIDLARGSKEFKDAVQEFATATGINGETAVKMLDWLETENKVNQATSAMKATVGVITARADAKAMAAEYGNEDFSDTGLQSTLIYAQADQIYKDAYDRMWWDWFSATLFNILYTGFNILTVGLAFGEERTKYAQKQAAYAEGMKELQKLGVDGLAEIGENTAETAERRDYGTGGLSSYHDTPFGWAIQADNKHSFTAKEKEKSTLISRAEKEKHHQSIKQGNAYSKQSAENISKMRRKNDLIPIQTDILYYQRKNSQLLEKQIKQDEERNSNRTIARAAGAVAGQSLYHLSKRPIGAKGAVKTPVRVLGHMLAPDDVDMPGASIWNKIFKRDKDAGKIASKGGKGLKAGGDVIEMEAKGGKYVAKGAKSTGKEGAEKIGKEGAEKIAAKTIGKTLGKALPLIGPAVTAAFSIAEHNPFEKHYNEDGSEKRALQSTGEVVGEVGGSLVAAGLGVAATAVAGPIAGAVVEFGASLILEPLGKAIGGVLGWLGDELINGLAGSVSAVWEGLTNAAGSIWGAVSGAATGVWDWISGGVTNTINGTIDWLTGNKGNDTNAYANITSDNIQQKPPSSNNNNTTVVIKNININTEDDPEKIKTAFMNLMIELEEQITPKQVSRTIGAPSTQSTTDPSDASNADANSDTNTNTNENTNTNTNINTNNNNPTT